jgi:hypothetical protein
MIDYPHLAAMIDYPHLAAMANLGATHKATSGPECKIKASI